MQRYCIYARLLWRSSDGSRRRNKELNEDVGSKIVELHLRAWWALELL